jgi:RNA polymerase sigma-70 factor, ECF subfamily
VIRDCFWVYKDLEKELENIVIRCKSGDREAFEELFDLYQPRLKYYIRRLNNSDSDIDDILQDIWVTVFRKIRGLKDAQSFTIWLYRIARNEVFGRFRNSEKFVDLPQENNHPQCSDNNGEFNAEDAERLHKALINIQPYHREVLTLLFIEQMSYQGISEVVGCSIGTVRSRIFYAKESLRKEMSRLNGQQ